MSSILTTQFRVEELNPTITYYIVTKDFIETHTIFRTALFSGITVLSNSTVPNNQNHLSIAQASSYVTLTFITEVLHLVTYVQQINSLNSVSLVL